MNTAFESPRALLSRVGEDLGTGDWFIIDQKRIDGFADDTGDHQWILVDVGRAGTSVFGSTIAHGYLTLSMAPAILQQVVVDNVAAALYYGLDKVRVPATVPVDSLIRGAVTLVGASERGPSIEGGTRPACAAEMVVLYS
jgi:acyl dehydratase